MGISVKNAQALVNAPQQFVIIRLPGQNFARRSLGDKYPKILDLHQQSWPRDRASSNRVSREMRYAQHRKLARPSDNRSYNKYILSILSVNTISTNGARLIYAPNQDRKEQMPRMPRATIAGGAQVADILIDQKDDAGSPADGDRGNSGV